MMQSAHLPQVSPRKKRGFTLIELMVTMAILVILATLAAPSFQQTIASSRLTSTTNELFTSLTQARTDAVRQGKRMTICVSNDGSSCATASTVTWSAGWISWPDVTRTTNPTVDAGETVSYVVQAMHESISIQGNSPVSKYVSFSPDGQSKAINGAFQAGTIRVCNTSPSLSSTTRARDIEISISGRMVITKPSTGVAATCPAP
jgi:type IV fimbrial biogenesis protein FimT